jgi:predicted glycosyltransferase
VNLLFDIGHPAHVHLLKNLIIYLKRKRHNVVVTTRNKDITNRLLRYYDIDFICISKPRNNIAGMILELIQRNIIIFRLHKKYHFDASIGATMSLAHLSAFYGVPSYNLGEDDDDVIPLYAMITFPFTTRIINPEVIRYKKWKKKRVLYQSYHELAYLHPNNFKPDESILDKYGLKKTRYVIIRLSALKAYHDIGKKGISNQLAKRIKQLCSTYKIIESEEKNLVDQIEPWDMHHVLAFSKLLISDSQTMTIEAAVLGIPSIRINSFAGRCSVIEELEEKFNLTLGFKPNDEETAMNAIKSILINDKSSVEWEKKREVMLNEKFDFNQWMINYFEDQVFLKIER